jgi:putative spermidine/putrescine transport system permease protein
MTIHAAQIDAPSSGKARRRPSGFLPALPSVLLLVVFFAVPVIWLLSRSVTEPQPGLQNYAGLLTSPAFLHIVFNTFLVAAIVTLIALVLGFPLAWLLVLLPARWSALVFGIVLLSMWTNLLARTYAWMVLLQSTGVVNKILLGLGLIHSPLPLVNNLVGVTIGMSYIMLPFIVMPIHATMSMIDPALLRAASLCGANRWQVFRRVFLPCCMPGIAAGCLMVFVMSLGYFVTPSLLGGGSNMMLAEYIAQLIQSMLDWGTGSAAALILLVATLGLYLLQLKLVDPLSNIGAPR